MVICKWTNKSKSTMVWYKVEHIKGMANYSQDREWFRMSIEKAGLWGTIRVCPNNHNNHQLKTQTVLEFVEIPTKSPHSMTSPSPTLTTKIKASMINSTKDSLKWILGHIVNLNPHESKRQNPTTSSVICCNSATPSVTSSLSSKKNNNKDPNTSTRSCTILRWMPLVAYQSTDKI